MIDPSSDSEPATLLLVEDNPGDARLVEEAFDDVRPETVLERVATGDEALDFVRRRGDYATAPRPNIVLLDWNLPGTSGADVLAELNEDPSLERIPVVVLTGSQADADILDAYANHANACITKSGDPDEYLETLRIFAEFWFAITRLPDADANL